MEWESARKMCSINLQRNREYVSSSAVGSIKRVMRAAFSNFVTRSASECPTGNRETKQQMGISWLCLAAAEFISISCRTFSRRTGYKSAQRTELPVQSSCVILDGRFPLLRSTTWTRTTLRCRLGEQGRCLGRCRCRRHRGWRRRGLF